MKPIEGVNLDECYREAQMQVQKDLAAHVTAQIKAQLMAVAQLKIKAANSVMEAEKLTSQLKQKETIIGKIEQGDWAAVAETAKDRAEAAEPAK